MLFYKLGSMIRQLGLSILLVSLTISARAMSDHRLQIGTGVFSFNALKNTTNTDASTSIVGTNYYLPLQVQVNFSLFDLDFAPRVLYTPLSVKSPEEGSSSTILLATLPWVYPASDSFNLSAGLGYMIRTIKGKGGTVSLNNGLGTSTFSLPERSISSKNLTTEFGVEWDRGTHTLALNSVFTSLLSERRSVSFLLTLNYKL